MAVNISIKSVPDELAQRLRERAARNHRSLQGELLAIIEKASLESEPIPSAPPAPALRQARIQGWKTPEQVWQELQASDWFHDPALRNAPRAVDIIRADRDSR